MSYPHLYAVSSWSDSLTRPMSWLFCQGHPKACGTNEQQCQRSDYSWHSECKEPCRCKRQQASACKTTDQNTPFLAGTLPHSWTFQPSFTALPGCRVANCPMDAHDSRPNDPRFYFLHFTCDIRRSRDACNTQVQEANATLPCHCYLLQMTNDELLPCLSRYIAAVRASLLLSMRNESHHASACLNSKPGVSKLYSDSLVEVPAQFAQATGRFLLQRFFGVSLFGTETFDNCIDLALPGILLR